MATILIFGYGRVGKTIAKSLRFPQQEIIIVDNNDKAYESAKLDGYESHKGSLESDEEFTNLGIGTSIKFFYCVSGDENINLFATLTARYLDKNLKIFARSQDENTKLKLKLAGANDTIDFNAIGAHKINALLLNPLANKVIEGIVYRKNDFYKQYHLIMEEITISEDSPLLGESMVGLDLKKEFNVILLGIYNPKRGFLFNIGGANHFIEAGDTLVVIGATKHVMIIRHALFE